MTEQQAKANQDRIAAHYELGWWYGTRCRKCCEVFPKLMKTTTTHDQCYYECEVCGKKTKPFDMPWQSEKAWNNGEYVKEMRQLSLF